jgi:hypothetical protein
MNTRTCSTMNLMKISWLQILHKYCLVRAAWSKAWIVFAPLKTGIVGSNPTQGMDVCVYLFCDSPLLCVGSGLATGWSPVQRVLLTMYRIKKVIKPRRSCVTERQRPVTLHKCNTYFNSKPTDFDKLRNFTEKVMEVKLFNVRVTFINNVQCDN